MKLHANARTCPRSRCLAVGRVEQEGWTLARAAEAAGVSVRTLSRWLRRFREEGKPGLHDRSSAPSVIAHRTPEERVVAIAALRRLRMTGAEIAECLRMPHSTVSAVLTRIGLGKLSGLEPAEPANRYERKRPGELLHIDIKKLGRIARPGHRVTGNRRKRRRGIGWEYVHVCVDDATRLAYVEVLEDEKAATAVGLSPSRNRPLSVWTTILLTRVAPNTFKLRQKFEYEHPDYKGQPFVVPLDLEKFETDLASVPRLLAWFVPLVGTHLPATLLHDASHGRPSLRRRHACRRYLSDSQEPDLGRKPPTHGGPIVSWDTEEASSSRQTPADRALRHRNPTPRSANGATGDSLGSRHHRGTPKDSASRLQPARPRIPCTRPATSTVPVDRASDGRHRDQSG